MSLDSQLDQMEFVKNLKIITEVEVLLQLSSTIQTETPIAKNSSTTNAHHVQTDITLVHKVNVFQSTLTVMITTKSVGLVFLVTKVFQYQMECVSLRLNKIHIVREETKIQTLVLNVTVDTG